MTKENNPTKAVIILSGGMNSTTLLYDLVSQKYEVPAITFDYNQKHKIEIAYAKKICKKFRIPQ
jgi:7-cyano-7-deazaguanine synthase